MGKRELLTELSQIVNRVNNRIIQLKQQAEEYYRDGDVDDFKRKREIYRQLEIVNKSYQILLEKYNDSHSPTEPVIEDSSGTEFDTLQEGDYVPNLSKECFEKIIDIEAAGCRLEWYYGLGLAYYNGILVDTDYKPNHHKTQLTAPEFIRRAENTFKEK